jgi:hypothetical protein
MRLAERESTLLRQCSWQIRHGWLGLSYLPYDGAIHTHVQRRQRGVMLCQRGERTEGRWEGEQREAWALILVEDLYRHMTKPHAVHTPQ